MSSFSKSLSLLTHSKEIMFPVNYNGGMLSSRGNEQFLFAISLKEIIVKTIYGTSLESAGYCFLMLSLSVLRQVCSLSAGALPVGRCLTLTAPNFLLYKQEE